MASSTGGQYVPFSRQRLEIKLNKESERTSSNWSNTLSNKVKIFDCMQSSRRLSAFIIATIDFYSTTSLKVLIIYVEKNV